MMGVKRVFGFMGSLFDFINVDARLRDELPRASLPKGVRNYLAGILLFLISSFVLAALAVVYLMLVYDATSAASLVITAKPAITKGFIVSSLVYFGLITFPFLFLGTFLHQAAVYLMAKLAKGKGTYVQQYFMSSYTTLVLGVASLGLPVAVVAGIFLPCTLLFFALIYLVAAIYLAVFVQAKTLIVVHKIGFTPALAISLLVSIGSLLAYILLQIIVAKYGFGPNFMATYGMTGMNTSLLNVNMTGLPDLGSIHAIVANNSTAVLNATNSTG